MLQLKVYPIHQLNIMVNTPALHSEDSGFDSQPGGCCPDMDFLNPSIQMPGYHFK
jgi:hypothetical protein